MTTWREVGIYAFVSIIAICLVAFGITVGQRMSEADYGRFLGGLEAQQQLLLKICTVGSN